jgi:hypothetical protein
LTVMKKAQNAIEGKVRAAHDWLEVSLYVSWMWRKLLKILYSFRVVKYIQVNLKFLSFYDNVLKFLLRF